MSKPLKGFITYSHKDAAAKDELRERLAVMEQKNELTTWHDGEITAGDKWYEDISKNLEGSDILLYLVSAASLASKNCNKELAEALTADITVIPIILEHCDWQQHQLSDFEVLPLKGKPISKWEDSSEGWQNVVDGIRAAINKMQSQVDPLSSTSEEELRAELEFERGNIQLLLGQMGMAIEVYSEAIKLNPRHASAYNNRGAAYDSKREHDRAIEDYTKAIELDPEGVSAYSNRGNAHRERGKLDLAIADCNKAIELDPEGVSAYNNRGAAYAEKGELDRAITDCNKAIELDPKLAEAYNNRANAYRIKGEFERAIADCNKAIELNPKLAGAYNNRGVAYKAKGEFALALEDYNKAIELDSELAEVYVNRGNVHRERGEMDKAIADCNKAIELDPELAGAYNNRGVAYEAKGEFALALADWNKAIELDPELADVYYNRGMMWLVQQRWENFRSGFLDARDVGIDIAIRFRNVCGSVENFERITGIQLPADIAAMLTSSS